MNKEYFLSINEVSRQLNLPAHTLRYWEKQFPAAIRPTTGTGGRRYYRPETVTSLETIKDLLYNRGMTIAGVRKLLKNGGLPTSADHVPGIDPVPQSVSPAQPAPVKPLGEFTQSADLDTAIDLLEHAHAVLANN